jgi:hypothetical protein
VPVLTVATSFQAQLSWILFSSAHIRVVWDMALVVTQPLVDKACGMRARVRCSCDHM